MHRRCLKQLLKRRTIWSKYGTFITQQKRCGINRNFCRVCRYRLFLIVKMHSPGPCPAGCVGMVSDLNDHLNRCNHCGQLVYTCLELHPDLQGGTHKGYCKGCGVLHYTCGKADLLEAEEPRYKHRLIEGTNGLPSRYACKPEDTPSVPIPVK